MTSFSIAGLQLAQEATDNLDMLCEEIRTAKKRFPWLDMIMFGELATYGVGVKHAQPLNGIAETQFAATAKDLGIWLIPGSLYEAASGAVFNMTPVINPDGDVIARYRKMYPFLPYEKGVAAGEDFVTFDVDGVGKFGVSICYDMWFPETTRSLVCQGAEVILHPTLTNTLDRDAELAIARANAAMNQCYFFDINCGAPLGMGQSIIVGPGGEVLHQAGAGRDIMPIEIDLAYVRRVRERGWNNLGQPLKSFRDNPVRFPAYGDGRTSDFMRSLGELKTPEKE